MDLELQNRRDEVSAAKLTEKKTKPISISFEFASRGHKHKHGGAGEK